MPRHYMFLLIAVAFEMLGTTSMQASQQFTKPWWIVGIMIGFAGAFYFMTLTLQFMPLGLVYAIWSGLGIVLIGIFGWVFFKQALDFPAILGMGLIIAGVITIHLFSNTATH